MLFCRNVQWRKRSSDGSCRHNAHHYVGSNNRSLFYSDPIRRSVIALPQNGSGNVKPGTFPWLLDADDDGYPSAVLPDKVQATAPTANHYKKDNAHWTSIATPDCYDSNAQTHPGQVTFQTAQRGDGSWDYDCSGSITYQLQTCNCQTCTEGCPASPSCTYPTETVGYTCGEALVPGPGSCSRVNDGYGTCTQCNNGADGNWNIRCL